jgi:adenylate kinase
VLYVNEAESVRRQLARGKAAVEHNARVKETGQGDLVDVRETDTSLAYAKSRYKTFSEQALDALESLKKEFPYHVIDGLLKFKFFLTIIEFYRLLILFFFSFWKY